MKVLHVTPHLGGGVGAVIRDWLAYHHFNPDHDIDHEVAVLDYANDKSLSWAENIEISLWDNTKDDLGILFESISATDIVLVHFWDHPMLSQFLSMRLPPCRLIYWCHKNYDIPREDRNKPDYFIGTSPIQDSLYVIRSTVDLGPYYHIKKKPHNGFNVGFIGNDKLDKMHPGFFRMGYRIKELIPEARFTIIGSNKFGVDPLFEFVGPVDDIKPYLSEIDLLGYPLKINHYGTCEQVIGEAMAVNVPVVCFDNPAEKDISLGTFPIVSSEDEYVTQVKLLHDNKDYYEMITRKQMGLSFTRYNIERENDQFASLFELIMKTKKRER